MYPCQASLFLAPINDEAVQERYLLSQSHQENCDLITSKDSDMLTVQKK